MDELAVVLGLYKTSLGLGEVDPQADFKNIQNDLIFLDLLIVEKRFEKSHKQSKVGTSPEEQKEQNLIKKCKEALDKEIPLRNINFNSEEEKALRGFSFLSAKPILIILNMAEKELNQIYFFLNLFQLFLLILQPIEPVFVHLLLFLRLYLKTY